MSGYAAPTLATRQNAPPPVPAMMPPTPRHAFGNQAALRRLQAKLVVGAVDDPLEREADAVASDVMRMPDPVATPRLLRKCAACEEEESLQAKSVSGDMAGAAAPAVVTDALRSPGQPLDAALRGFFEPRFGANFADVRVHHDAPAAASTRAVGAQAYTVGNDIVFGSGRYTPGADDGRRLLAHELTHVMQQSGGGATTRAFPLQRALDEMTPAQQAQLDCVVRLGGCPSSRDGGVPSADDIANYNKQCTAETRYTGSNITPDAEDCIVPTVNGCTKREADCRATPAYAALDAEHKKIADDIIATLAARSLKERFHRLGKLKELFDTPVKSQATITTETNASTQTAAAQEQQRLAKPAEAANKDIEEKGSVDPARKWTKKPGKFGGNFWVDNTSPAHIFVKDEVYLHPTGTGTAQDVARIKSMEDAIEKSASAPGYSVNIIFVDRPDGDAFNVEVDPSRWEVATNWSGGDPVGFAHELHHLMAFELDKYNYIDAHASNQSMVVGERLVVPKGTDQARGLQRSELDHEPGAASERRGCLHRRRA